MAPRRRNPAGTVDVLLMNPSGEEDMAARRRKTTTRRRKAPTRRRRTSRATTRRRRTTATRRRRNPKIDVMGTVVAAVAGAALGAGAYALDGQNLSNNAKAGILGAAGVTLGIGVSGVHNTAGAGIAGAGAALATYKLMMGLMAGQQTAGMGAIGYRQPYPQMGYAEAQMSAVEADLGAVEADLGYMYAQAT
jgi:hypothetical protein